MKRILVAVDATDASTEVAAFVNEFFDGLGVEVFAVHAGGLPAPWYPADVAPGGLFPWPYAPVPRSYRAEPSILEDAIQQGEAVIERSGVDFDESVVAVGNPVDVIEQAVERHGIDLLVVGRSHRGLLDRILNRSPAREFAKDAPVPVLIVH